MAVRETRDAYSPTPSLFFSGARDASDGESSRIAHLASSFMLSNAEVAFFDRVVAQLPHDSRSFVHLKEAYAVASRDSAIFDAVVKSLPPGSEQTVAAADARLWNTLLGLVQVRGATWLERWDTVRVSLGLDPVDVDADGSIDMYDVDAALGQLSDTSVDSAPPAVHAYARALRSAQSSRMSTTPPGTPPKYTSVAQLHAPPDPSDAILRTADRFHAIRCQKEVLRTWRRSLERFLARYVRVSRAADRLGKIRALESWQLALARRRELAELATSLHNATCAHRALDAWARAAQRHAEIRKSELVSQLRRAFHESESGRCSRIARSALATWRCALRERHVCANMTHALAHDCFAIWMEKFATKRALAVAAWRCTSNAGASLSRAALRAWLQRARLNWATAARERACLAVAWHRWWMRYARRTAMQNAASTHIVAQIDRRCAVGALLRWEQCYRDVQHRHAAASRSCALRAAGGALDAWRSRLANLRETAMLADQLAAQATLRRALGAWRAARWSAFARRVCSHNDGRAAQHALLAWREKSAIRAHYRTSSALLAAKAGERRVRGALGRWITRVVARREADWSAAQLGDGRVVQHALGRWTSALRRVRRCMQIGDMYAEELSARAGADMLSYWRRRAAESRVLSRRLALADAALQIRRARRALVRWGDAAADARLHEPVRTR